MEGNDTDMYIVEKAKHGLGCYSSLFWKNIEQFGMGKREIYCLWTKGCQLNVITLSQNPGHYHVTFGIIHANIPNILFYFSNYKLLILILNLYLMGLWRLLSA